MGTAGTCGAVLEEVVVLELTCLPDVAVLLDDAVVAMRELELLDVEVVVGLVATLEVEVEKVVLVLVVEVLEEMLVDVLVEVEELVVVVFEVEALADVLVELLVLEVLVDVLADVEELVDVVVEAVVVVRTTGGKEPTAKLVPLSSEAVRIPAPVPELQMVVPATAAVTVTHEAPFQNSMTARAFNEGSVKQTMTVLLPGIPLLIRAS